MFARERAAELQHEVGDLVRDRFELADALLGFQVDDRAGRAGIRRMRARRCRLLFRACE